MNYLAHAFLSFHQPDIIIGNMISDFVKGKKQHDYPHMIKNGIILHRRIDAFTDEHLLTKEVKKIFSPAYGLYAGAFTDVVFDYFLANDPQIFTDESALSAFSMEIYTTLEGKLIQTPPPFQMMFPYMRKHNWLYNYRFDEGMHHSFAGLVRRAKYMDDHQTAFDLFLQNREAIQSVYDQFFPLLKNYAHETLQQLLKTD